MQTNMTSSAGTEAHTGGVNSVASQITSRPVLAIVGVLLGAVTSVFTGRLLSIGLSDVQGAIGASSDAMSWLATSFNAANMFVGPLTVFMGAIFGPRRVLLWASLVFMLSELLSPLVAHNFGALIVLQFIAGLSAGTYYPLTITVVVRNLPLKLIHLGIAAYALDILASTHIATVLESWYMTNLSWHWIFWNALLVTPLLMACVFFGIPKQPLPQRTTKTDVWGFLYASAALTLIYCALDQGQRLDWLNSGVVCALLVSGAWLAAVAVIKRLRRPHPLVNLRFLATRNLLLLGVVLTCFRFLILAPTLLVPRYLELLHGYRPEQTGQVLAWVAIPELIAAPVAGLLLYKADSRLICAIGFALVGFACFADSRIDPGWTGETFVAMQVLNAIGLAFALTGLVTTILRNAVALGALQNPVNILTISCWFQTCRLFGGEIGKSLMLRFLQIQGTFHYTVLAQSLDGGWLTEERLKLLIAYLFSGGSGLDDAKLSAINVLASSLGQQIGMLAVRDGFILVALSAAFCLFVLGFITYAPPLVSPQRKSASG